MYVLIEHSYILNKHLAYFVSLIRWDSMELLITPSWYLTHNGSTDVSVLSFLMCPLFLIASFWEFSAPWKDSFIAMLTRLPASFNLEI